MTLPLQGISVVEIAQNLAGPIAAEILGHMGADEGFLAQIRLFPARGCGAVVMINAIQGWRLRDELLAAIGREYGWPPLSQAPVAARPAHRVSS